MPLSFPLNLRTSHKSRPSEDELERLHEASARGEQGERLMDTDDDASVVSDVPNGKNAAAAGSAANNTGTPGTR